MTTSVSKILAPLGNDNIYVSMDDSSRCNSPETARAKRIPGSRRFSEAAVNFRKSCLLRSRTVDDDNKTSADNNGHAVKAVSFGDRFEDLDDAVVVKVKNLTNGSRRLSNISESYVVDNGKTTTTTTTAAKFVDTISEESNDVSKKSAALGSDEEWLKWAEAQFSGIAKGQEGIGSKEFKHALKAKESFFANRFFAMFDKDGSGVIDPGELMDGLYMLTKGTTADKLRFVFDVYDQDGNGYIDIEELRTVLQSCLVESSISLSDEELDMLTESLYHNATDDVTKDISFDEFQREIEKHPIVLENLTIGAAQWLRPPGRKKGGGGRHRYFTARYLKNNVRKLVFVLLYVLVNIVCFVVGCVNHRNSNPFIIAARGAGLILNFNAMFILVLMLRKSITWLRTTPIRAFLPLDQHIMLHKFVGVVILVMSLLHSGAHIGNAALVSTSYNVTMAEFIFTTKANIGWMYGSAPLTGVVLLVILLVICICSMPFVRRSGHFQIFYWTHVLFLPFWIVLIIHAPHFWYWFIVPGVLFLLEKITRSKFIKSMRYGETFIKEINLLPSGVTHLVISKPANMTYQPGDYIFLQIPVLAVHEWHPFTISSAPELEDVFWVHVRSAGHWTNKLYQYFTKYKSPRMSGSDFTNKGYDVGIDMYSDRRKSRPDFSKSFRKRSSASCQFKSRKSTYRRKQESHKEVYIKVYIDGPYGTASREMFGTEHAVLIGSGIGVTPYASVLQSVMYRFLDSKRICPNCDFSWCGELPQSIMNLNKVDFIWINRDQKSFEWFISLLTQLEIEQRESGSLEKVLDIHLYMTSALSGTDMKGLGLQMALDLIHQEKHIDLITGLRTRTNHGRPNWNEVFKKLSRENKGKIKVFFCGAPVLARTIKSYCEDFGFSFCKENF